VVIATVFLTIIGMTAGFMLGERRRHEASGGSVTRPAGTETTTPPVPSAVADGTLCPEEMLQLAIRSGFPGELFQVMKIKTNNGTTVWICQDYRGHLYFQSKTGGYDVPLRQGVNALFLSDVVQTGTDQYTATANEGNTFVVTRKSLEVRFVDGRTTQTNPVVDSE
jgi:hypothetical protein